MLKLLWTVLLVCLTFTSTLGFNTLRTGSPGVEPGEVDEVPVLGYGDGPLPPFDFSAVLYSLQQEIESAQPAEGLHLLP